MEDYKKKYKDALERARVWKEKSGMPVNKQGILDDIFPELKESEDERIRKEIIEYIKHIEGQTIPVKQYNSWIAWLEKQGEQEPTRPVWKYKKDHTPLLRDSFILNKYGCVAKSPSGALVSDVWVLDFDELAKLPKEEFKGTNEQNYIDEIKPKFKIGDWVRAISSGNIFKILSVNDGLYRVLCYDGVEANYPIEDVEKDLAYWTIKDAKDGDILYTSSTASHETFIFKELSEEGNIKCYCSYDSEDGYCNGEYHFIGKPNFTLHPANIEQCNLLFQKIKEAGYIYDPEKKELKEIEQNINNKIEPKFHAGDFITDGERIFQIKETVWERNNRNDGTTYCESLIVNLRDGNTYANNTDLKEYHLWSIEDIKDGDILVLNDEYFLFKGRKNSITEAYISYCFVDSAGTFREGGEFLPVERGIKICPATKEQRDFLLEKIVEAGYIWDSEKKMLTKIEDNPVPLADADDWVEDYWKHNKVPNPNSYDQGEEIQFDHDGFVRFCKMYCKKSAWSENDEQILEIITSVLRANFNPKERFSGYEEYMTADLINWLNSLEERQFKPTDEQIIALRWVLTNIPYYRHKEELSGLLNQIKNL